jgi:preprotein translocase subunit SecB
MIASALQLEWYFIKEVRVVWQGELEEIGRASILPSDLDVEVLPSQSETDPLEWAFELSISLSDTATRRFPYAFKIVLVGFFQVSKEYAEKGERNAELLAMVNAPAVLYSAAREQISTITSRGPVPPALLPTVAFLPVGEHSNKPKDLDEAKSVSRSKRTPVRPPRKRRASQ